MYHKFLFAAGLALFVAASAAAPMAQTPTTEKASIKQTAGESKSLIPPLKNDTNLFNPCVVKPEVCDKKSKSSTE